MPFECNFPRHGNRAVLPWLYLLTFSGGAVASSIPFPVGVNNSIPGAYVGEIYGSQFVGTNPSSDGSAVGLNAANTSIPFGTRAELNTCGVPLCGGGTEFYGGFADVPTGTPSSLRSQWRFQRFPSASKRATLHEPGFHRIGDGYPQVARGGNHLGWRGSV